MLFYFCCCYCYPFLLYFWKLLVGWFQNKHTSKAYANTGHVWVLLDQMREEWGPRAVFTGLHTETAVTWKRPHCNAVTQPSPWAAPRLSDSFRRGGRVGPYLSCASQWERHTSHETQQMQAFLRTRAPALGRWRAGSAFIFFKAIEDFKWHVLFDIVAGYSSVVENNAMQ